jgi:apolipoprotein N-acyltransferase
MVHSKRSQPILLAQRRLAGRPVAVLLASATAVLVVAPGFWGFLWPLAWVALVPLFLALRQRTPRQAFFLGWWAETLIMWLAFYWLVATMVRFGDIPLPLSLLFFGIIGMGNGVRLGIFAWWIQWTAASERPWWYRLCLPPCAYVSLDYLFPRVFPWYLGVTQWTATPLIQIADVTGVHGITALLLICSMVCAVRMGALTDQERTTCRRMALAGLGLLIVSLGYGFWRIQQVQSVMQQEQSLRLALIQPNIGLDEKGQQASSKTHLHLQVDLSLSTLPQQPDLIIWPESMYPNTVLTSAQRLSLPPFPDTQPAPYWLIGALTQAGRGPARQVFNSALLVGPDARILGRYDKQQLLAFGEYIPLQQYLPFLRHISPAIGDLARGLGGIVTLPNGASLGPLICYEDILPHLSRQATRQGAAVLVNLTNDAWFGQTHAPYLHRLLAAFRTIENRRYLVRVTNTGLTSVIDALGREQVALPIYTAQTLVHTVQPLRLSTVYTRWGDWFAQLCSLAAILLSVWHWYTRRQAAPLPPAGEGRGKG